MGRNCLASSKKRSPRRSIFFFRLLVCLFCLEWDLGRRNPFFVYQKGRHFHLWWRKKGQQEASILYLISIGIYIYSFSNQRMHSTKDASVFGIIFDSIKIIRMIQRGEKIYIKKNSLTFFQKIHWLVPSFLKVVCNDQFLFVHCLLFWMHHHHHGYISLTILADSISLHSLPVIYNNYNYCLMGWNITPPSRYVYVQPWSCLIQYLPIRSLLVTISPSCKNPTIFSVQ